MTSSTCGRSATRGAPVSRCTTARYALNVEHWSASWVEPQSYQGIYYALHYRVCVCVCGVHVVWSGVSERGWHGQLHVFQRSSVAAAIRMSINIHISKDASNAAAEEEVMYIFCWTSIAFGHSRGVPMPIGFDIRWWWCVCVCVWWVYGNPKHHATRTHHPCGVQCEVVQNQFEQHEKLVSLSNLCIAVAVYLCKGSNVNGFPARIEHIHM